MSVHADFSGLISSFFTNSVSTSVDAKLEYSLTCWWKVEHYK